MPGLRDEAILESDLARPRHKWTYKRKPDLASLAAAYAYGLARNHAFRDGNKRVAFLTMVVFLGLNGHDLIADEPGVVTIMVRTAASNLSETDLAKWIRIGGFPLAEPGRESYLRSVRPEVVR